MIDWQKVQRLVAESMREIGILVAVFVPLEAMFDRPVQHVGLVVGMWSLGIVATGLGILVEAKR